MTRNAQALGLALALVLSSFGWLSLSCSGGSDYAGDMAKEHKGDAPVANEASAARPASEVESRMVTYATVNGTEAKGYLAEPQGAEGPLPGIIVIHEWWGLNDNIRSMADQLAGRGYRALAVDLYAGKSASTPEEAQTLMKASMEQTGELTENLKQAYAYLSEGGQKVGTIGWCFGGGWSLATALALPDDIDATVIYYGRLVTDANELQKLRMPILGFFGAEDTGIPVDSVHAFEAALHSLGKDAEIQIYEGAAHAFANPSGTNYRAEPAKDAWTKTLAFFDKNLKG
jgi:carboxymethylenebutenolidase